MITKNYIEMCKQAFQLQKWYKSDVKNVHEGDKYICQCDTCKEAMFINVVADYDIDYINERDMTDVDPIYKAMVDLSGVGCFGAFWDNEGSICLFSQEQLFEMVKPDYDDDWKVIIFFRNWIIKQIRITKKRITFMDYNIKELLLSWVMHEKYKKFWDGKKWK